jgi:hypothetical protein
MNEVIKLNRDVDGFDTFEDRIEGDEHPQHGLIQGGLVKFSNEATWPCNDEDLPPDLELVAIDVIRVVQQWGKDQRPAETRILEPGEKFPDIEAMNEAVPRSEWLEGPSGPRGPWQAQYIVYLMNPLTMDRYTFPTGTVGGGIAVRELRDKIVWMRRFRGARVYPVLTLSDTHMRTRFGGRQRPHFIVKRWIVLDGGEGTALPAPANQGPRPIEPAKAEAVPGQEPRTVEPPSRKEELDDEIPFDSKTTPPIARPDRLEEIIGRARG